MEGSLHEETMSAPPPACPMEGSAGKRREKPGSDAGAATGYDPRAAAFGPGATPELLKTWKL